MADERCFNLHGTAIAVGGRAALIRGPSGAGKSDLALRVLGLQPGGIVPDRPLLIADDRVDARLVGGDVMLSCPKVLEGLLEVRGIGLIHVPFLRSAALSLVVDLVAPEAVERMPEPGLTTLVCGRHIAAIALASFEASAPLKLVLALAGRGPTAPEAR
jgi:serine kinase of HPr protein (carbohydrate metabolism regulator)